MGKGCRICGKGDHWAKECPRNLQGAGKKGSKQDGGRCDLRFATCSEEETCILRRFGDKVSVGVVGGFRRELLYRMESHEKSSC